MSEDGVGDVDPARLGHLLRSRRRFLQSAIGAGGLGVAGCAGQEADVPTDGDANTDGDGTRGSTASPAGSPRDDDRESFTVEGEDYADTNWVKKWSGGIVEDDEQASNGQVLKLATEEAAPDGGYVVSYSITPPADGYYALVYRGTPIRKQWVSAFAYRVDDGPYQDAGQESLEKLAQGLFEYRAGVVELAGGEQTFEIRVNRPRPRDELHSLVVDRLEFVPVGFGVESIVGDAPMNIFEEGESVALDVGFNHPAEGEGALAYTVLDYHGDPVDEGTATVDAGAETVSLDLGTLPLGHYEIQAGFEGTGREREGERERASDFVGVVPAVADRSGVDHPFASMSGVVNNIPHDRMEEYAAAIRRSGVSLMREISARWKADVSPARGEYDWTAFDRWLEPLSEGQDLLYVNPESAPWARESENRFAVPDDLFDAYDFVGSVADRYRDSFRAWQVHNEPEHNEVRPYRLGAYTKMTAIALRDTVPEMPLVLAPPSTGSLRPNPSEVQVGTLNDDLAPYADVYALHAYRAWEPGYATYETEFPQVQYHQRLRQAYGLGDLPLWLTEAGMRIKTPSGRAMTRSERTDQARYVVTSAITALSYGVDKFFWFILHNNPARPLKHGLFAEGLTPRPSLVAYAVLGDTLGDVEYVGRLADVPDDVEGHVLRNAAGETSAVLWAAESQSVTVETAAGELEHRTLMGQAETRSADGSVAVEVGPDPIYLTAPDLIPEDAIESVDPDDRASEGDPDAIGEVDVVPADARDDRSLSTGERVVLAPRFPTEAPTGHDLAAERIGQASGTRVTLPAGDVHPVTVEVYNVNDRAVSGTVRLEPGEGWRVEDATRTVEVPANQQQSVTFDVHAGDDGDGRRHVLDDVSDLTVTGTFDGEEATRSVTTVQPDDVLSATFDDATPALDVAVHNPTDGTLTVDGVEWSLGDASGDTGIETSIAAGDTETLTIPVEEPPNYFGPVSATVDVAVSDGPDRRVTGPVHFAPIAAMDSPPTIDLPADGTVSKWLSRPYRGPEDLSAEIAIGQSEEALSLSAAVTDDVYFPDADSGVHNRPNDSVLLGIGDYLYHVTNRADGGPVVQAWTTPAGVSGNPNMEPAEVSFEREEASATTTVEATIPWSLLEAIDRSSPTALTVWTIDDDGTGMEGRGVWRGTVDFVDGSVP
jgi:hypothetical protein